MFKKFTNVEIAAIQISVLALQEQNPNVTISELAKKIGVSHTILYKYCDFPITNPKKKFEAIVKLTPQHDRKPVLKIGVPFLRAIGIEKDQAVKVSVKDGKIIVERIL